MIRTPYDRDNRDSECDAHLVQPEHALYSTVADVILKPIGAPGRLRQRKRMDHYADPTGYERYMGPWSASLAPHLLSFAALRRGQRALDLGCGTGSLIGVARHLHPDIEWTGVDPQPNAIMRARQRLSSDQATLAVGRAQSLPFADNGFDQCLSLLVLQEFEDRLIAVDEMVRVTRSGGSISACQWNYANMPIISSVVHVLSVVRGRPVEEQLPGPATADDLAATWSQAGCHDVSCRTIVVTRTYEGFEDLWRTLLRGSTPSTLALAALDDDELVVARSLLAEQLFNGAPPAQQVTLEAEALLVKGAAP